MERKTIYKSESFSSNGYFELEIIVGADKLPELTSKEIERALFNGVEIIEKPIRKAIKDNNPKTAIQTKKNKELVDFVFGDMQIFVEEIENKYCNDYCCSHLPWFIVTTKIGRFEIGWRKRVINIDWSGTINTLKADELFPNENVTKGDYYIHAWSIEDAKHYIEKIIYAIG